MKTFYEETRVYYEGVKYVGTVASMQEIAKFTGIAVVAEGLYVKFLGQAISVGDWVTLQHGADEEDPLYMVMAVDQMAEMKFKRNAKKGESDE